MSVYLSKHKHKAQGKYGDMITWYLKSQNLGLGPRKYIIASTDTRLRAKGRYGDMITWYLKSQNCLIFSQI